MIYLGLEVRIWELHYIYIHMIYVCVCAFMFIHILRYRRVLQHAH